jgi:hypothetical protein
MTSCVVICGLADLGNIDEVYEGGCTDNVTGKVADHADGVYMVHMLADDAACICLLFEMMISLAMPKFLHPTHPLYTKNCPS